MNGTDPPIPDARGPNEEDVQGYLRNHPGIGPDIRDALIWSLKHDGAPFHWYDPPVSGRILDRLVLDRVLVRVDGGRYHFRELQTTARGFALWQAEVKTRARQIEETRFASAASVQPPPGTPGDLFSEIIGYESVKRQVFMALSAPDPIHILLEGPPACLVADERVSMGNGAFAKIGGLGSAHLEPIRVSVQTGVGHGRATAERFHIYRDQPVLEMITESGKSIRGTPNQPVLMLKTGGRLGRGSVVREWRRLDQLKPGDRVATVLKVRASIKSPPATGFAPNANRFGPRFRGRLPSAVTPELASLAGYLLGDGWVKSDGYVTGMLVNRSEADLVEQLECFLRSQFGVEPHRREVLSPPHAMRDGRTVTPTESVTEIVVRSRDVTRNLGFVAAKRAPEWILASPDRHVAAFLRWLFEADGHVRSRRPGGYGNRAGEVALTSVNIELLRDAQTLLLRFGIYSAIESHGDNAHRLVIARAGDIGRFASAIGFASAKKCARMDLVARTAASIRHTRRRKLSERVVSVRPCGRHDVFDIEVPKGHRFVANGVVVHNTAKSLFLEGLATLPGAVYRFGDAISRAGIRRLLMDEKPPWLIVDELDKLSPEDDTAMLEFMERQRVSMTVTGINRDEAINIRVFAAANKTNRVRPELLSRFHRIRLRDYTEEEFRAVARAYLKKRGVPVDMATLIADAVGARTRDIRDCRRIASMARSASDAEFLIQELGKEARV